MSDDISYAKEAFFSQYNLIILGGSVVLSLVLMEMLPLLLVLGGEIIYLALVPGSQTFQRRVRARRIKDREAEAEDAFERTVAQLSHKQQEKVNELRVLGQRIKENLQGEGKDAIPIQASSLERLDQLVQGYVRMQIIINSYRRYMSSTDWNELQREMMRLEQEMERDSEKVRETKQKRLDVLGKRLDKFSRAQEKKEVLTTQLATMEDIMRLVYEQSVTLKDPKAMTNQLQSLVLDMEATEEAVAEIEALMEI